MQLTFIFFVLVASACQSAAFAIPFPPHSKTKRGTGIDIAVNSDTDFCTYLPPHPGQSVSATETDGDPFCTVAKQDAKCFPSGFIQSAHFYRTNTYVQVTGRINHTAYGILTEDRGGQYDRKNLPHGTCNGLKHWVNLIEPDSETFCIRCCQYKSDCNIGISTYGCHRIVPGDYT